MKKITREISRFLAVLVGFTMLLSTQSASALGYACIVGPYGSVTQQVRMLRILTTSDISNWVYAESETYARIIQPSVSNWDYITYYGTSSAHGLLVTIYWITGTAIQVEEFGYFGLGATMYVMDGTTRIDENCGAPWVIP